MHTCSCMQDILFIDQTTLFQIAKAKGKREKGERESRKKKKRSRLVYFDPN